MKRRDTCDGQYYPICNPQDKNLKTGKFCIQATHYCANNKSFIWDWIDPETKIHYHKIIDKDYIIRHCTPCPRFMYDKIWDKYKYIGRNKHCYLITFNCLNNY